MYLICRENQFSPGLTAKFKMYMPSVSLKSNIKQVYCICGYLEGQNDFIDLFSLFKQYFSDQILQIFKTL